MNEQVEQYLTAIDRLGLRLVQAIDTHTHADHITALGELRERTDCVTVMGQYSKAECVSAKVKEGEILRVDGLTLGTLFTPGHTDESFSLILDPAAPKAVFTGDVLLIRSTGRTDFQNEDPHRSWDSITNKLFALPDETYVWPAHDYKGWTRSTILEEKRHNPRIAGKTEQEYVRIMESLNLPAPEMMDVAIPANIACGRPSSQPERS